MNEYEIVQHMIKFIEKQEREQQADFVSTGNKAKSDMVNRIIKELDKVTSDEDK